ncbi:MAG: heme exporter protein B [Bacteroidetes bacterium]|nr:MAG: heme exporter protein B [Bacteroidota bacterium]
MSLAAQVAHLFRRELMLEQRQKYAFQGILLYVISTIFICKFSFREIQAVPSWNALFWIILLFAAVNAVAKSFVQENRGRLLYLYTLCDPRALLLAKMLYNALLMFFLAMTGLGIYLLLVGNPVQDYGQFLLVTFLGSLGFATVFTMISAIASKAGNNFTLMAILGFPVMLPLLITVIRASKNAIDGLDWSVSWKFHLAIAVLNVLVVALSYLLFPYLWRD